MEATVFKNNSYTSIKVKTAKPLLWIAMASMVMLFAALTSAYLVRHAEGDWIYFKLPAGFYISTVLMVLSSITLILALKAAKTDNMHIMKISLGVTLLLGIGFVISQFSAYGQLIDMGVFFAGVQSNASGSYLYVLSGLHLVHLIGGVVALIIVFVRSLLNKYSSENLLGLELCSIYWHFLDILWIYLFAFVLFIH